MLLENTARYAGLLLAPAEGFEHWPRQKKGFIMLFWLVFGDFWCPVVTLVIFSGNLSKFEKYQKKTKKSKRCKKIKKIKKSKKNT